MFRIRQIADDALPGDRRDIARVQAILKDRLPGLAAEEIQELPDRLRNPLKYQMRAILLVADDLRGHLRGFALVSYAPDVDFCLLDYLAAGRSTTGGVGGALYQRVREVARDLGVLGLFFECLPDDPEACSDLRYAVDNSARLRFYERFGARPIVGTDYERPLEPGQKDMPHLVFDDLGSGEPLSAAALRAVVEAILRRKYGHLVSEDYVQAVLASIVEDPVRLRPPRYTSREPKASVRKTGEAMIALVVNDRHDIHHVRERGYVEAPARIRAIRAGIDPSGLFWEHRVREFPEIHVKAVHDPDLVRFLKRVSSLVPEGKSIYPYVFPQRNRARLPRDLTYAAGYYCIDTFTPLNRNAYAAAKRAVDCTLTAATFLLEGHRLAYSLVRPPGHHAERAMFGGFCYFNNAAIAAHYLLHNGRVAILDVDYHHGNGQQDIFYRRGDVLTVSIHGDPAFAYPFFVGFKEERGEGEGEGCNLNLPLPELVDGERYRVALEEALRAIERFDPRFLIVCLGLDTGRQDPTGTWSLAPRDFAANGRMIGRLRLPTLVVQEGGYRTHALGSCARAFFEGLAGATR